MLRHSAVRGSSLEVKRLQRGARLQNGACRQVFLFEASSIVLLRQWILQLLAPLHDVQQDDREK